MRIHFLGANRQVTGSRYCLEAAGRNVLVDCGLFQERAFLERNWLPSPIPPSEIDAVLLTHAPVDHCGLLPKLVNEGFRGSIYATPPSIALAEVLLRDTAKIQMEDAEQKRRRHRKERRRTKFDEKPLYTDEAVEQTLPLLQPCPYGEPLTLPATENASSHEKSNRDDFLKIVFHDAGHILGSAMLEIQAVTGGESRRVVFSGDIGQWDRPLVRDPTLLTHADVVVMESTYGDRDHPDQGNVESQLAKWINHAVSRGGNVIIPTFAVERAQELMYHLGRLVHADRIPDIPIYLDSPMAVDATEIFRRHRHEFDLPTQKLIDEGQGPLQFPGLRLVRSVADSKAINATPVPSIIMSTSGMCTAGRIKHHLKHNISRPQATIVFVGYQPHGTLGRQILDGKEEVRIHGQTRKVRASVHRLYGLSAHADRGELLRWISHFQAPHPKVFLTHGDEEAATSLAEQIRRKIGCDTVIPQYGDVVEL